MQLVGPAHKRQFDRVDNDWLGAHRASADIQQFGLARDRNLAVPVNHLLALSNPDLVSAPATESRRHYAKNHSPM